MRKMTLADLQALTDLEAAIKKLPEVGDPVSVPPPLVMTPEYREAKAQLEVEAVSATKQKFDLNDEDVECGGGDGIIVQSCKGEKKTCANHGMQLLKAMREEMDKHGIDLEPCPHGCGRDAIECWKVLGFSPEFVLKYIIPKGQLP